MTQGPIHTDAPQNKTHHQYVQLEKIKQQAGAEVVRAGQVRGQIEGDTRKEAAQQGAAQKEAASTAPSNAHAEVATSLITEAVGLKGVTDIIEIISERVDAAGRPSASARDALGGFIGDNVRSMDDMMGPRGAGLSERATLAGNALTGTSEAAGDSYQASTQGWRGTEMQMTYTTQLANARNHQLALQMQQEYEARLNGQMYAHGFAPGGMGSTQRHAMSLSLNHMGPKAPNFTDTPEEDATNWGAGNVTG